MSDEAKKSEGPCGPACTHCGLHDRPPDVEAVTGWRLVVGALAVFVLPLVLAIAGAAVSGGGDARQLLGALIGLAAGLAAGVVIARLVCRAAKGAV